MCIQVPFNNKQFNTHIQFQWCIISNTQHTEGGAGAWAESPPPLCLPQGPGRAQDRLCLCVAGSRNSAQAKLSNYFYFLNACMRVCSCPFIWCGGQTSTLGILLYGVHYIFWGTLFHWTWNSLFQVTDWPAHACTHTYTPTHTHTHTTSDCERHCPSFCITQFTDSTESPALF